MEKGDVLKYAILGASFILLVAILFALRGNITGFAIYQESGTDFDNGTYNNTEYNGSGVILSFENNVDANTVALWHLDESSGTNAQDSGTNSLNGTSENTNWLTGKVNNAYDFSGDDNYIMVSDSSVFDMTAPATIEFWIKPEDITTDQRVIYRKDWVEVKIKNGELEFKWKDGNKGDPKLQYDLPGVGVWTHIASTISSDGLATLYINGESVASESKPGYEFKQSNEPLYFGIKDDMKKDYSGFIDEIKISNIAKTQEQIQESLKGSFISQVIDATNNAIWNNISWSSTNIGGLDAFVRSCNDDACSGESWTDISDTSPQNLSINNLTYFQYKFELQANSSITPALNSISIDYNSLNAAPTISIIQPTNTTLSYRTSTNLNFTATDSDDNLDSCWYHLNEGANITLASCANITINVNIGSNSINIYANDTEGEISSDSVIFEVTNSAPSLTLVSPQDGANYGYNESLALDFTISDEDDNLDSCWYSLNSADNTSLPSCANITIDVPEGSNIIIIYANDTQGEESSDSATFNVDVGAPTIVLNSPIDSYTSNQAITFNYTPTDAELQACELWGNFTGTFEKNQTDNNPTSGSQNTFSLTLSEGEYLWNVKCNDSLGNEAFNGNKTFYIDTTDPLISISQPTGTKTSRTSIPLTFSTIDNSSLTCLYNITTSIGTEIVSNINITNCTSTTFNVASDGDYIITIKSTDAASNSNTENSSFSVDTTSETPADTDSPSSSSGGGGGGSSGIIIKEPQGELKVSNVENIIAREGDKKIIPVSINNKGTIFLNNCKLIFTGDISSWTYSEDIEGIAPGEDKEFKFDLNIPDNTETGDYSGELEVKCNEASETQSLEVSILGGSEGIKNIEIQPQKDAIKVTYDFNNSNFIGQDATIEIWITDEDGIEIKRISDSFNINKDSEIKREVLIELPDNLAGIYSVYLAHSSDLESYIKKSVVLGKTSTTGQVVLGDLDNKTIGYAVFILIIIAIMAFIVIYYKKTHKSKSKKKSKKKK